MIAQPIFYVPFALYLCNETVMQQAKTHIEMAIESIQAFANDGKLDADVQALIAQIRLRHGLK